MAPNKLELAGYSIGVDRGTSKNQTVVAVLKYDGKHWRCVATLKDEAGEVVADLVSKLEHLATLAKMTLCSNPSKHGKTCLQRRKQSTCTPCQMRALVEIEWGL